LPFDSREPGSFDVARAAPGRPVQPVGTTPAPSRRPTPQERIVLGLLAEGLTAEAIARALGISPRTVHRHLEHLYRKLGTVDRLTTVMRARSLGLI
jgi:DNA-binding NarL/FixJ family response regulator